MTENEEKHNMSILKVVENRNFPSIFLHVKTHPNSNNDFNVTDGDEANLLTSVLHRVTC